MSSLFHNQEDRRGFLDSVAENTGRHAIAYGHFDTTGAGEIENPKVLSFGIPFIERPAVAYSYYLDDADMVDTRWPRCWGGILGWDQDENGLYTGAHAFVVVETTSINVVTEVVDDPYYTITHFFTFNGMGLKFVVDDFSSAQVVG
jgi:hypothetical protein